MINMSIELIGLDNIPLVEPNDDVCQIIKDAIEKQGCLLKHGDIILIAETLISKAEGNVIKLGDIIPSEESIIIAKQSKKDSKLVEAIINESREVVAVGPDFIITETKQGFVCANSGIDESNVDEGLATPMPEDADRSAKQIREFLENEFDEEVAVLITDTQGRAFRNGAVGVAIGCSGINPLWKRAGEKDLYGRELQTSEVATGDELAAAASLVMGQADEGLPVVIIRGFDNFDKASYYRPRITTVSYEREVIAEAAMDLLVQIWGQNTTADCKTVPVQMLFQDSCGCKPEQVRSRSEYIEDRIFQEVREIDLHNEIMELKHNLIECEDYKQMAQYFTKCVCGLRCKGVRIWMNQDLVEESLSDSMGEASYITDGYPDTMHVICEKGMEQEYSLYVYAPLHFREREVGYVVLADCDYMLENQFLFETMNTYLESLEYLYRKLRLRKANEKLSRLYVLDSLTGLYNRMAYQEFAEPLYEKCRLQKKPVTVMFIDADHLKYINDTFGHDMGNLEIRGIADGIRKVFPPEAVSMRYGGDEFVVLLPGCEKTQAESLKAAFLKALDEISKSLHAEFDVEASIGYEVVLCGEKSLNECINNADEKMYQFKKARKAQRE